MKVLQINAVYGFKSTGMIVKDIGEMLALNGDEAYFAYQTANLPPENGYRIGNWLDWKSRGIYPYKMPRINNEKKKKSKRTVKARMFDLLKKLLGKSGCIFSFAGF